ncbi:MAG: 4-(cytidine 5'-diphospho)-2-C-methyl-D-erythritol kinase, partial [Alphaproteobacteria bacterium]|nr:4-(cytidine 5'-diphospho)-2-C-methyl-D-erythritol kinase [Alphaproteobacteria bacterium]
ADENLVLRAARALAEALGRRPEAQLRLTKNIPVAAGLGGGSADAAATLRALQALWQADLADALLADLAARLGADVPVCLAGVTSSVSGVGELVRPAPALPACGLLLVNPGSKLSTPSVFQAAAARRGKGPFSDTLRMVRAAADVRELAQALAARGNDLTDAAISLAPEIAKVLTHLRATQGCRYAAMSGSGATCFALYDDVPTAEVARLQLRDSRPLWWSDAGALL